MSQKRLLLIGSILASLAITWGCNKDKDLSDPVDEKAPEIFMSSPVITEFGTYNPLTDSDSLEVDIRFEDETELDKYSISVVSKNDLLYGWNAFKTSADPWEYNSFGDLQGKVGGVNDNIYVPWDPSNGVYEFTVTVWDKAGHSTKVNTWLWVSNRSDTIDPEIIFQAPDTNVVDTFIIGNNIVIKANVQDIPSINPMDAVDVYIRNAFSGELLPGGHYQWDSIWTGWMLDTIYTIPAGTAPGNYNIEVFGRDVMQNIGRGIDSVYIKAF